MSHITVLALFEEEPKDEDLHLAVIEKMEPFEEGGGGSEEWDYWMIEDDDGKPLFRGKLRDYKATKSYDEVYAVIDTDGEWATWPDFQSTLADPGELYAVEIDAHR